MGDYLSFVVSKPVLGVLASSFREHEVQLKNSHVNNVLDDGRVICVFVKAYRASSRRVSASHSSRSELKGRGVTKAWHKLAEVKQMIP